MSPERVTLPTVNVTLADRSRDFTIVQLPADPVTHDPPPFAPALNAPLTVAAETGPWSASWTTTVTMAVQVRPWLDRSPSRSPTCMVPSPDGGELRVTAVVRLSLPALSSEREC